METAGFTDHLCHILVLMTSQLIALFVFLRTLLSSSGLQNMYVSFWRLPGFSLSLFNVTFPS